MDGGTNETAAVAKSMRSDARVWDSATSISAHSARATSASPRRKVSPLRTSALADAVSVGATSAQAAIERERASAHRSRLSHSADGQRHDTVVPISHDSDYLPPHMKSALRLLDANISRLEKFVADMPRWTSSEMHAANSKVKAMLTSQRTSLEDLRLFCGQEARFAKERVADLAAQVRESDRGGLQGQMTSLRFLYSILNNVTNICNAQDGLLFLHPSNRVRAAEVSQLSSPREDHGTSAVASATRTSSWLDEDESPSAGAAAPKLPESHNVMLLAAHVSTQRFSPLADGSTHSDIYDVCQAVARSCCAANLTSKTTGAPMHFNTIVACPVFMPMRTSTVYGVLCLVDKVSPYGMTTFTQQDELRLVAAAEHIGEVLLQMPLRISQCAVLPLSPSTWQEELARWRGLHCGTSTESLGTGIGAALREPSPAKFIFRSDYSGRALAKMTFKSRTAVEPGEVLLDVLERYTTLERQLDVANKRAAQAMSRVNDAEERLLASKEETRKAVKDAYDMRVALERALRTAVFNGRERATPPVLVPQAAGSDSPPLHSSNQRPPWPPAEGASSSPRSATASTTVSPAFAAAAAGLRQRAFFPQPPAEWNGKAKPVGAKPFIDARRR